MSSPNKNQPAPTTSVGAAHRANKIFTDSGLAFPNIPNELAARLTEKANWLFSSREITVSPYNLQHYAEEAGEMPDYVILAHSGHGINSYAIQYYLVHRGLRMFLHLGWGGVYMDGAAATEQVHDCFLLADKIVEAAKSAERNGKLNEITIVASDFYGSFWSLTGDSRLELEKSKTPAEVLADSLHFLTTEEKYAPMPAINDTTLDNAEVEALPRLHFRSVSEHDIDMLLGLLLTCFPSFPEWLLSKVMQQASAKLLSVSHGVVGTQGESDVEVFFETTEGETIALLIENKIKAQFQPHQLSRYIQRGEGMRTHGRCDDYRCLLMAPRQYLGDKSLPPQFSFLPYEQLREWLSEKQDRLAHHGLCLLDRAIDKGGTGTEGSEMVTGFWRSYYTLASELAPELNMAYPEMKPATSAFIFFPANLPEDIALRHKMPQGHVDLIFYRKSESIAEFESKFFTLLEPGMRIVRSGGSIIIREEVDALNLSDSFETQRENVQKSLATAQRILRWWKAVSPTRWPLTTNYEARS